MIFLSLIDIDCKKDMLFLFTFEKELPDGVYEDDYMMKFWLVVLQKLSLDATR